MSDPAASPASPAADASPAGTRPRCLLCGADDPVVVFHEFGVDIVRCKPCGHVYSTWVADIDFDGYFETQDLGDGSREREYWDAAHAAMYADFGRRFLRGRSGTLLDVGAGLGFFVKHVTEHFPEWEPHGSEISAKAVAFANEQLGLPTMVAGRVQDGPWAPGTFDLITMWDVIEHLADPDGMLQHLRSLLKPAGRLFVHTPNIRVQLPKAKLKRWLKGMDESRNYLEARDHLHDYSPATLRKVLERNGFTGVHFFHLTPLQAVGGRRSLPALLAKNGWAFTAKWLHRLTFGAVNLGNLYAVAGRD
ncbi:MAG: class I SAM-dependent methyltransferase [Planctomycetota bacterium]